MEQVIHTHFSLFLSLSLSLSLSTIHLNARYNLNQINATLLYNFISVSNSKVGGMLPLNWKLNAKLFSLR